MTRIVTLASFGLAIVVLAAGCGGGGSDVPAASPLSVSEDTDGGLTVRQSGVPLGRVSLSAWNKAAGVTDSVRVTPSGGKLNIVAGTAGQANLAVGLFSESVGLFQNSVVVDVSPATYRGHDNQGFWYWEVPKGTADLTYSVAIIDATNDLAISHQRKLTVEVSDAPAPAVPTVKLFTIGGSTEVTEVTVGTQVEARLENTDELRIIQPDGLALTMIPNGGKVTFLASQVEKYSLIPLKAGSAGATVTLNVKAGSTGNDPSTTSANITPVRRPANW